LFDKIRVGSFRAGLASVSLSLAASNEDDRLGAEANALLRTGVAAAFSACSKRTFANFASISRSRSAVLTGAAAPNGLIFVDEAEGSGGEIAGAADGPLPD